MSAMRCLEMAQLPAISVRLLLVPLKLLASGNPKRQSVLGWRYRAVDILIQCAVRIESLIEIDDGRTILRKWSMNRPPP
jgi:hypothetical protein